MKITYNAEADTRVMAQAWAIEEKTTLPFITFPERQGIEKGLKEGREKGRSWVWRWR